MVAALLLCPLFLPHILIFIIINAAQTQSAQYYIKDGEVPSYLYRKFDNVKEDIFPSVMSVEAAFSTLKGTLLYSMDKNMNQLVVTMRDDVHFDTRYGLQVELNKQFILVSLSKLCGRVGSLFDERKIIKLGIHINADKIMLMCNIKYHNSGNFKIFPNEKRNKFHDNYPIPYSKSNASIAYDKCVYDAMTEVEVCACHAMKPTENEAHLWVVNHPIIGEIYSNRDQMYGCIFNVFYYDQPIIFKDISANIGNSCRVACRDDMCNGGECFVIYSEEPICNCTKAFMNGRLCNNSMRPMNFRTTSQIFNYKMFKLSWKSKTNSMLELINSDIRILIGRKNSNLFFQYNFSDSSRKTVQAILSDEYVPNTESICIIYFHEQWINIITYTNYKWSSLWIPCVVDIRQEHIYTMVFSSGEGVMDFVFKYIAETLWISVDFIRMIELEKEPVDYQPKIISIFVPIASVFVIISLLFLIVFKRQLKRVKYSKIFHYYDFEGETQVGRYVNRCMIDLGWDIEMLGSWKEYIIGRLNVSFPESKLERVHRLIQESKNLGEEGRGIVVLFIHARLFVLQSMMSHNDTESTVIDNRSIQYLTQSIIYHQTLQRLPSQIYLLSCMMELIEDISEYYNINEGIRPLIDAVISLVSMHIIIGRNIHGGDVAFLESCLCEDNCVAVWPTMIIYCYRDCSDKYINIMRQYLYDESKYRISDYAILVYYMTMEIMSKNEYKNYTFTEVDYRLLSRIYEYDDSDLHYIIRGMIAKYFMKIIDIMWSEGPIKENIVDCATEHQKILINCLALVMSRDEDYDYIDTLVSLLDDVHGSMSVSVACVRIAEVILYHLSRYRRWYQRKGIIFNRCLNYLLTENISEEIRLSSSIIICYNIKYETKVPPDVIANIHSYLVDITIAAIQSLSGEYLGLTGAEINEGLSEIKKY